MLGQHVMTKPYNPSKIPKLLAISRAFKRSNGILHIAPPCGCFKKKKSNPNMIQPKQHRAIPMWFLGDTDSLVRLLSLALSVCIHQRLPWKRCWKIPTHFWWSTSLCSQSHSVSWGSLFFMAEERKGFQVLAVNLRLEFLWDAVWVLIVLFNPLSSLTVLNSHCSYTYAI